MNKAKKKENALPAFGKRAGKLLLSLLRDWGRLLTVLVVTALLLVVLVVGVVFVISKGQSPTIRSIFVYSVHETSAIGFLKDIFLSPEEVDEILSSSDSDDANSEEAQDEETDTSLVTITHAKPAEPKEAGDADPAETESAPPADVEAAGDAAPAETESAPPVEAETGPQADAWGYVDEDGDGLILVPIKGKFTGYMLIVLDPSRVVLGCSPETMGSKGYSVQEYVEMADAVAGVNGGSFADEGGKGNGSMPDTLTVHEGELYCSGSGVGNGFVGIDDNYILHVGISSSQAVKDLNIQEGCSFRPGPVLVKNGKLAPEKDLKSGLNPRTAIGQRSDGAILLVVIEGRQPSCLGASYQDVAELMLRNGAVNASNLDGGSSSMMWYNGEYVNNSASVIGIRDIPTSWIVLKEGRSGNG